MTRNERKRRTQRLAADAIGIALVAAIFATGVVVGRCTALAADKPEPAEPETSECPPVSEPEAPNMATLLADEVEVDPAPYYPLTEEERDLVARVVMGEAGGEGYDGQRLVAQCILNACLLDGMRPAEAVEVYQYTPNRPEPSESVLEAVSAVFDRHDVVTDELILWFYAPAWCYSDWHESQRFVLAHGGHRFFAAWS